MWTGIDPVAFRAAQTPEQVTEKAARYPPVLVCRYSESSSDTHGGPVGHGYLSGVAGACRIFLAPEG